MTPSRYQDLGYGIHLIDTHYQRPGLAACYLVQQGDQAALIDTGTAHSVAAILELLERLGLTPGQVRYVMPTHVHLDHAGASGILMEHFPNAELIAHPLGARHLIDPTKLTAGATAVYGEERFRADFGELRPIPAERVTEAPDGMVVELSGRPLRVLDTPGHARHHYCVYDELSRGLFTGDTFGISYPEFATAAGPFLFPTTTPVQFDPMAWQRTIEHLLAIAPERLFLTHFGMVEGAGAMAAQLRAGLDDFVRIAESADTGALGEGLRGGLRSWYRERLTEHGCALGQEEIDRLLALDIELNAQGLEVWLQRRGST